MEMISLYLLKVHVLLRARMCTHTHTHTENAVQECLLLCSETRIVKLYKYENVVRLCHKALQVKFDRPALKIIKYSKTIFL